MKTHKKVKIRERMLAAFTSVLFFSFLLIGILTSIVGWLFAHGERDYPQIAGNPRVLGATGVMQLILVCVMFIVAVIVTYFLAKSLTHPIEKLGEFAQGIGHGNFEPNNFEFREIELEKLNQALNKSVKQLGEYDSQQKTFFQNASHELRTPLMSIKCYAEGVTFGIMESKQACETILLETDKLADLVTDLLYISKIDNITTAYKSVDVDLCELITAAAARQESVAEKNNIRFVFDFDATPINFNCVGELIARAMDNLISNAIRYANSEIILGCKKTADGIILSIKDDGKGILPEALPHLFERFYKGTDGVHGIGLSIVKSVVEQQGGRVKAENATDGGAIFTITFGGLT